MGLALASAVAGCADDSSKTDLLGTPDILQVMVLVDGADQDPVFTDLLSGYAITYEQMLPLGGNVIATSDYAACYLFNTGGDDGDGGTLQGVPTTLCQQPSLVGQCKCPDFADATVTCQQTGDLIGRCVDQATGLIPIVRHAQAETSSIRITVGDLLDGPTCEHFACACQGQQLDDLDPTRCTGPAWANPDTCNTCGTSATDTTAGGRCLDTDSNGLPDFSSMIAGLYTLTCALPAGSTCPTDLPGWAGTAASCVYTSPEGAGFCYPSGNQFQSSVTGLGGVGPAIVLSPATALPTGATCTIAISDAIKDQKGASYRLNAIHSDRGTPTFTVQDLAVELGAPAKTINVTNSTALVVEVDAVAPLSAADLTADVTDLNATGADPVTQHGTNSTPAIDGDAVEATFADVHLIVNHTYTVKITGTATNEFGTAVDFTAAADALEVNTTAIVTGAAKK